MIYCLTGKILKKSIDSVVISCGGVGYLAQIPATTGEALPAIGQEGTLYTILNVTENDVALYGFATTDQRDCFKMLTGVSGVGPKAGLAILSVMTPEKVAPRTPTPRPRPPAPPRRRWRRWSAWGTPPPRRRPPWPGWTKRCRCRILLR